METFLFGCFFFLFFLLSFGNKETLGEFRAAPSELTGGQNDLIKKYQRKKMKR